MSTNNFLNNFLNRKTSNFSGSCIQPSKTLPFVISRIIVKCLLPRRLFSICWSKRRKEKKHKQFSDLNKMDEGILKNYPNVFWSFLKDCSNALYPVLSNKHALGSAKSSKCSISWEIGITNFSYHSHIGYVVDIIWVEHGTLENRLRKIQGISTIVVDLKIQCQ